jgi:hypothetical protein
MLRACFQKLYRKTYENKLKKIIKFIISCFHKLSKTVSQNLCRLAQLSQFKQAQSTLYIDLIVS